MRCTSAKRNIAGVMRRVDGRAVRVAAVIVLGACSGDPRGAVSVGPGVDGGAGGDASQGAGGGDASTTVVLPGDVWSETSRKITVACFGYWTGSMQFAAERGQLSANELALLGQLRLVDSNENCLSDTLSCGVTIVQGDGQAVSYDALQGDALCTMPSKLIAFESLDPFLRELPCRYAKDT